MTDLIILDDFGVEILDPVSSRDLLEVIEDRFGTKSTIIATQLPVTGWHDLFEDSRLLTQFLTERSIIHIVPNPKAIRIRNPTMLIHLPITRMNIASTQFP